jgi:hypothetical protein
MPSYRANVTDRSQTVLETAQFEDGIPVHENSVTRVVARGSQTGTQKTNNAGTNIQSNAGVIMSHDDQPGRFLEGQGKP